MDIHIYVLKVLTIMMFSTWKTYVGATLSYIYGFSYAEMLLYNLSAALFSTLLFLRYSRAIGKMINRLFPKKEMKRFNPKYRKYIRFWNKYGLYGTMFLTPVVLGIPVGAFLAVRFGTRKKTTLYLVSLMIIIWLTISYYFAMFGIDVLGDGYVRRFVMDLH